MARPFLSLIIPAYNEAERLPLTLIDVDHHLSGSEYSYEILVINDGSTDRTKEIVQRLAGAVKNVKVIDNPEHRGKGAAARVGMLAAKGNWRLLFSADNAVSVVEFQKIVPDISVSPAPDILIGARRYEGFQSGTPILVGLRVGDWALSRIIGVFFKSRFRGFTTGFQCFQGEVAEQIFSRTKLDESPCVIEPLALGERLGYTFREVPVSYATHQPKFHPAHYLQIIGEAIKIRWWLSRGKYKF